MGSDGDTVEIPQIELHAAIMKLQLAEEQAKLEEVHQVLKEASWRLGEVIEMIKNNTEWTGLDEETTQTLETTSTTEKK